MEEWLWSSGWERETTKMREREGGRTSVWERHSERERDRGRGGVWDGGKELETTSYNGREGVLLVAVLTMTTKDGVSWLHLAVAMTSSPKNRTLKHLYLRRKHPGGGGVPIILRKLSIEWYNISYYTYLIAYDSYFITWCAYDIVWYLIVCDVVLQL